jgi:hypothetical protein
MASDSVGMKRLMASDFLNGCMEVSESKAMEIIKKLDEANELAKLYRFSELLPSEDLSSHVRRNVELGEKQVGPWIKDTMVYATKACMMHFNLPDLETCKVFFSSWWGGCAFGKYTLTPIHPIHEWNSHVRDILSGVKSPNNFPGLVLGATGADFEACSIIMQPLMIVSDDKTTRYWGLIRQGWIAPKAQQSEWALQNFQLVRNTPCAMTVTSAGEASYSA